MGIKIIAVFILSTLLDVSPFKCQSPRPEPPPPDPDQPAAPVDAVQDPATI